MLSKYWNGVVFRLSYFILIFLIVATRIDYSYATALVGGISSATVCTLIPVSGPLLLLSH
jgi:hypothetical protein